MARSKNKLNPYRILTLDISNTYNIPMVVTNNIGEILCLMNVPRSGENYDIRHNVLSIIDDLIQKYNIDTIIFEQNKLFIDKMDKYPDPYILRDVMLGYGIQVTIEDRYFKRIVLLSLPEYEWKKVILGNKATLTIDFYKAHVLKRTNIPIKYFVNIENDNYYKVICLSESILFRELMDKKYQINKGELEIE